MLYNRNLFSLNQLGIELRNSCILVYEGGRKMNIKKRCIRENFLQIDCKFCFYFLTLLPNISCISFLSLTIYNIELLSFRIV